jgi:nicotinamidase-related amidase
MKGELPIGTGLVVIDVQKAINDPLWSATGERNHPEAEANIARLLDAWRRAASVCP